MSVRRDGLPGKRTPDGILTRFVDTTLGRIFKEIEARPDPATIDLGYLLLSLSEDTVIEISEGIEEVARRARIDGKDHDLTIGIRAASTGLTVHCNGDLFEVARQRLHRHCDLRKYSERAETWFGICIHPVDGSLRFGVKLQYKWEHSVETESRVNRIIHSAKVPDLLRASTPHEKVGRNQPCPCGSGKKYKRCCLQR